MCNVLGASVEYYMLVIICATNDSNMIDVPQETDRKNSKLKWLHKLTNIVLKKATFPFKIFNVENDENQITVLLNVKIVFLYGKVLGKVNFVI